VLSLPSTRSKCQKSQKLLRAANLGRPSDSTKSSEQRDWRSLLPWGRAWHRLTMAPIDSNTVL
jgi:hypothetical protein